jgi:O-antigen/teichoic acid export membrane protein
MLKFLKQFFIYGFASVLGKIAAVFLLPLYTNVLSKEEYGALAMITAAKGIIDMFSNLNIHSGVARDYYEKNINRTNIISTGFFSILSFSLFVMFALIFTRDFWEINVLNVGNYDKAFLYMLFTIPAGSLFSYFGILTRYKQKAIMYSIGNLLQLIIQISLTIFFILIIRTGIVGVFYGMLAGELVGIVFFFILNREYVKFTFNRKLLTRVLKYSMPTLPAILAIWADSNLGQIFIGKYISLADAGVYSIALRVASVYLLIRIALENVWLPFVFENLYKNTFEKDVMRLYNAATIVLLIISLNVSVLSEYIVLILSTPEYISAALILTLLTMPMSLSILINFTTIGPNISRKTKYTSYANVTGSVINLLCLAIFLPIYGVVTVPICLLLSQLAVFLLTSHYTKKEIGLQYSIINVIILVAAILLTLTFMQLTNNKLLHFSFLIAFNTGSIYFIFSHYKIKNLLIKK